MAQAEAGAFARVPGDDVDLSTNESCAPGPAPEYLPGRFGRTTRFAAVGIATGIAIAAALTWKPWCFDAFAENDVTSLSEVHIDDGLSIDPDADRDALTQWLSGANAAGEASAGGLIGEDLQSEAHNAISKAMSTDDPVEAQEIVGRAMRRAVEGARARRRELKNLVKKHRPALKGKPKNKKKPQKELSPQQAVYVGHCVFDSLTALNSFAFVAANLNDASKTCGGVLVSNMLERNNTGGKVCAINVAFAFGELANLAAQLSLAANDCATTLVPNVDALCAAGISGLVSALAQMAGSGAMMAASCNNKIMGTQIPQGATASNFGSQELPTRRLSESAEEQAPPRVLLYGGGKGSISTQCGLQITGILWALGQAATFITQSAKGSVGQLGKCPPSNVLGGKRVKGPMYKFSEAFCTYNVAGILVAYAQVIAFLQAAIVNCQDVLNLKAICGAGVTGLLASFAGIAQAGAGVHISCDTLQDKLLKKALKAAGRVDGISGEAVSRIIGGGSLGRRLEAGLAGDASEVLSDFPSVEELQQRFQTPEQLWQGLGYDLDDGNAPFRKEDHFKNVREVVKGLAQKEEVTKQAREGLLSTATTCPV